MAIWLAVIGTIYAAAPDQRVERLIQQDKPAKARALCDELIAADPFDTAVFGVCADLFRLGVADSADALDAFVAQWGGSTAANDAHERAAELRLDAAGDDSAAIERVVREYPDSLIRELATDRLWALAFQQAQGDPQALLGFILDHPAAPQVVAAQELRFQLIWNKADSEDSVAAWSGLLAAHPQHPRRAEAVTRRVDAQFVETVAPLDRLALARSHPEHPAAASTLALVLPELVVLDLTDEVQRSTLASIPIDFPAEGQLHLLVAGQPVSQACPGLEAPVYEDGGLRFPYGACQLDQGVLDFELVVSVDGVQALRRVAVRQGSADPTRTWAEHFMTAGTLRPACDDNDVACPVGRLRFGADGDLLVTTEGGQGIAVWQLGGPQPEVQRLQMGGKVFGVALGPGGDRVAVAMCGADESTVTLHSLPGGRELGRTDFQCGRAVAWSQDGRTLATVDNGRSVALRDASALSQVRLVEPGGRIGRVTFSPDGAWLAVVTTEGIGGAATVHVVDAASGTPLQALDPGPGEIRDLAFSSDGATLQAVTQSRLTSWDPNSGTAHFTTALSGRIPVALDTERGPRRVQLALAPDQQLLAVGGPDGSLDLLQSRTGQSVRTLPGGEGPVWDIAISTGGDKVAWSHESGELRIWTIPGESAGLADR